MTAPCCATPAAGGSGASGCWTPLPRRCAAAAPRRPGRARSRTPTATLADEARRRGVVRRSRMRRLGARDGALPDGAVVVGRLARLARPGCRAAARAGRRGAQGVDALRPRPHARRGGAGARPPRPPSSSPPWWSRRCGSRAGGCCPATTGCHPRLARALEELAGDLDRHPVRRPRRRPARASSGSTRRRWRSLARAGHVLRVGETVLLPGADDRAVELLAGLPQPFTTSAGPRGARHHPTRGAAAARAPRPHRPHRPAGGRPTPGPNSLSLPRVGSAEPG